MLRFVTWAGLVLGMLGVISVVYGFQEKGLAKASTSAPETTSLDRLIVRGPAGNPNIILTDFTTCDNFIVETKKGSWRAAWVPIIPRSGPPGAAAGGGSPPSFKAIIYSSKARNEGDLFQRCNQSQLRGMVVNTIRSLDSKEKRLLAESYPQTDFATCIIFEEGKEPASEEKLAIMIFGGIGATVVGLGLLGLALVLWRKQSAETARQTRRKKKRPLRGDDEDDRPRKRRSAARDEDEDDDRPRKRRAAAEDDEDDVPRRKRRAADEDDDDRPSRRRSVARDDDEDDRPRRRRPVDDDDRPRRPKRDRDD